MLILTCAIAYSPGVSYAEGLPDAIRKFDLNDYALGLGFSSKQNPYRGLEETTFFYPYLTSFKNSYLSTDAFIVQESEFGLRKVTDNGWEFGAVGRVQTLGTSIDGERELSGLSDRKWTLELAPAIGWRGWPVQIHFRNFFEVLDQHDGVVQQLQFSYPREWSRGFITPSVALIRQSSDYTGYYWGVDPAEVALGRLEYDPSDAYNVELDVSGGYRVSDKWLLSYSAGIEFYDSEISDSPIVEDESRWSASLGFAYNADIFQPREINFSRDEVPWFRTTFAIGGMSASTNTTLVLDSPAGVGGTQIDLEEALDLKSDDTFLTIDGVIHFGDYHRIALTYFQLERSGSRVIDQTINFGAASFQPNLRVESDFDTDTYLLRYGYSVIKDDQKEFGVYAGAHFTSVDTRLEVPGAFERDGAESTFPKPAAGLFGSITINPKLSITTEVLAFRMDFDRYEGQMSYVTAGARYFPVEHFGLSVGYTYYRLDLDVNKGRITGAVDYEYRGPALSVVARF